MIQKFTKLSLEEKQLFMEDYVILGVMPLLLVVGA